MITSGARAEREGVCATVTRLSLWPCAGTGEQREHGRVVLNWNRAFKIPYQPVIGYRLPCMRWVRNSSAEEKTISRGRLSFECSVTNSWENECSVLTWGIQAVHQDPLLLLGLLPVLYFLWLLETAKPKSSSQNLWQNNTGRFYLHQVQEQVELILLRG